MATAVLAIAVAILAVAYLVNLPARCCQWMARRALDENATATAAAWIAPAEFFAPGHLETQLLKARLAFAHNRPSVADEILRDAALRHANDPTLSAYRETIKAAQGDLDAIERLTTDPSGLVPPKLVFRSATRCAMYHGRFAWGLATVEQWKQSFPDDASADYHAGRIYELQENLQPAIDGYRAALRKQPTLGEAAFRLGVLLRQQGQFREAEQAFLRGASSPLEPIVRIEAADCAWRRGATKQAWKYVEPVADLRPEELRPLYLRVDEFAESDRAALIAARVMQANQDWTAAEQFARRVIEHHGGNREARGLLAAALQRLGRQAEARHQIEIQSALLKANKRALALQLELASDPRDLDLRCELAEQYIRGEAFADAQVLLQEILADHPKCSRARQLLSRVSREKSRKESAHRPAAVHQRLAAQLHNPRRQDVAENSSSAAGAAETPSQQARHD